MDNNILTIVVLGIYTAIYLTVFFVQKAQINKLKEVNASMKSFMEIFKIEDVRKFVELKEENAALVATNTILNNEKLQSAIKAVTENNLEQVKSLYEKTKGEEHMQMTGIVLEVLHNLPKDERENFIDRHLPNCKHYLMKMINDPEFDN